ncbi:MAG TPA: MerR family transcriptional regulator [Chloroflexota bacterium]|nr:MerR family transcriptional regulator [Chloroflexota bacterium]
MLKIGDFSRLGRVTVKALRHYDRIGLLRPGLVDRCTGYRYYSLDQLPRLNRILALKDLGLSLDEIGRLVDDAVPAAEIRRLLEGKRVALRQRLREEHARLSRVEARLRQIEMEGHMPDYEVVLKSVEPLTIAGAREVVPTIDQMPARCAALYEAVVGWIRRAGARPAGPCLGLYHNSGYTERDIDTEMAVPVNPTSLNGDRGDGVVAVRELPAVPTMASALHRGPYEDLVLAWQALAGWIEANGYRMAGPEREIYLRVPHEGEPLAEVQVPVEKV